MTLSRENFQRLLLFLGLLLATQVVAAMVAPEAGIAAAGSAVAAAERLQPQGQAAQDLDRARDRLAQAQVLLAKRRYRDALALAEEAQVAAGLAQARARLALAQQDVDEKMARNADLRRQLLVMPESHQ